jgi:NAD(P)-dependent dehydrogenase (short-subunit alcohol dehydrogenase family)
MVSICDLTDPKPAVDAIASAGGKAIGSTTDIMKPDALAAMVDTTVKAFGGVHILVNNAAIFGQLTFKPFFQITAEEWDRVMTVNVRGSVECVKAVLARSRKGNEPRGDIREPRWAREIMAKYWLRKSIILSSRGIRCAGCQQ